MHSAIYRGWLRHRRFAPRPHAFRYGLFLMYLDLSELETVFERRWFWSTRRPAFARFDRADHFGDPNVPLDESVRELVEARTGRRPSGPIRLLTHFRYFGYCFNPVCFYYCFDAAGAHVETVVAEVTSTPWGERHCYVLDQAERPRSDLYQRYRQPKSMHVSPFMPMEIDYTWGLSAPGEALNVHMALHRQAKIFDATMCLKREPMTGRALARTLIAFPFMTLKVITAIHWEALRLWVKRVPVHTHPKKRAPTRREAPHGDPTTVRTP